MYTVENFVIFCTLVTGLFFGFILRGVLQRYVNSSRKVPEQNLPEADIKALQQLNDSNKAYISLELGVSWLSVTLIVLKERVEGISVGDKVELSMLSDVKDSAMLIHGNAYNLSMKAEDCARIEVLAIEELSGAICVTAKLC